MTALEPQTQPDATESNIPRSDEFERVVIGALLNEVRTAYPICMELLGSDYGSFYDVRHQSIYRTVGEMVSEGSLVDMVTVYERLRRGDVYDQLIGPGYLAELSNARPSAAGVGYYAGVLAEYHKKRQLLNLGSELKASAESKSSDVQEILANVSQKLTKLNRSRKDTTDIKTLVMNAIGQIEECHNSQGKMSGMSTGFPDLDKMTSGFHNGEMIVIAARPSVGKTSLSMNIVEHVALELGLPVGVFSLEMTAESLVLRMLCSRARVNLRNIRDGFLAERDFPKLTGAAGKLSQSPLYIDDTAALSVFELRARAMTMRDRYGIRLLVIDYMQLMKGTQRKNGTRENEVSEISSGVKSIAKDLGIPVVVLSQLNRDMEREKNRRPRLSDLRESGAIEQDADLVAFLWRPPSREKDADEEDSDGSSLAVNLSIAKQRNGPTGDVPLTFMKCYTRFESAAKVSPRDLPPSYDTD